MEGERVNNFFGKIRKISCFASPSIFVVSAKNLLICFLIVSPIIGCVSKTSTQFSQSTSGVNKPLFTISLSRSAISYFLVQQGLKMKYVHEQSDEFFSAVSKGYAPFLAISPDGSVMIANYEYIMPDPPGLAGQLARAGGVGGHVPASYGDYGAGG